MISDIISLRQEISENWENAPFGKCLLQSGSEPCKILQSKTKRRVTSEERFVRIFNTAGSFERLAPEFDDDITHRINNELTQENELEFFTDIYTLSALLHKYIKQIQNRLDNKNPDELFYWIRRKDIIHSTDKICNRLEYWIYYYHIFAKKDFTTGPLKEDKYKETNIEKYKESITYLQSLDRRVYKAEQFALDHLYGDKHNLS